MIFESAINRINNINWENVGKNASEIDVRLGCEFLRRLARFYKKTSNKQYPPLFSNIAKFLGDDKEIDFTKYYSDNTKEFLSKTIYQRNIFEYYLQIALFAEEHNEARQYLDVYEPLIEICERGGSFKLRKRELEIEQIAYISLTDWYNKYLDYPKYFLVHYQREWGDGENEKKIPEHLMTTYQLLSKAFNGVELDDESYFAVLYYLYEYMCDGNLADIISIFTGKSLGIVMNDVLKVSSMKLDKDVLYTVKNALDKAGFKEWSEEGE